MPEADDHGVAEILDAVGIGTQVVIVGTGGDRRHGGIGRVDLHEGDDAVLPEHLRE